MKIVNILDRYLFSETITPFLTNLVFFSVIFTMRQLLYISDIIVNYKADVLSVCFLLVYAVPYFLQYVIPISITAAILIVCINMLEENEFLILKISGISVFRLVKPVFFLGLITTFITGLITLYIFPMSEKALKSLSHQIIFSSLGVGLKERVFNNEFENSIVYLGQLDSENGDLADVFIEENKDDNVYHTIIAPRGKILNIPGDMVIRIKLFDGSFDKVDVKRKSVEKMNFNECDIFFHVKKGLFLNKPDDTNNVSVKELNFFELKSLMSSVCTSEPIYHEVLLQYHKIFAIPFSCLFMGIMALSVSSYKLDFNRFFASSLALVLFLVYYVLLSCGIYLGRSGFLHPAISVWLPNILLGLISLVFLVKANNK